MKKLESKEARAKAAMTATGDRNRVTLEHLLSLVVDEEYIHPECAPHLTICVLKVTNGFTVVGKSAPADPTNFNEELGRNFAYEDALAQLWPLEGYLLRDRLA